MSIQITHLKRCDLIAPQGRYDSSTAPELDKALHDSIEAGVYRIVLDMSGVEYFGSAAIRALVGSFKECRRWNRGDVRLANLPDRVRGVLGLAGILPLLQVYDDSVTAVGSF
ncbi:MAG: STAS domain-containing protein [Anaerolineae bacterium]